MKKEECFRILSISGCKGSTGFGTWILESLKDTSGEFSKDKLATAFFTPISFYSLNTPLKT